MKNEKTATLLVPATAFGAQGVVSLAWLARPKSRLAWRAYLAERGIKLTDWKTDPLTLDERRVWHGELQAIYNDFMAAATDAIINGFDVDIPSFLDELERHRGEILVRFRVIGVYDLLYRSLRDLRSQYEYEVRQRENRFESIEMSEASHPVGAWQPDHVPRKPSLYYLRRGKK